jgi:hypothetical protein
VTDATDDTDPDSDPEPLLLAVPEDLRRVAPDGAAVVAFDPRTLAVEATDRPADPDPVFERVHPSFPDGRAGVAAALLCRALASLALRREAATTLVDAVEAAGGDPLLLLDRLADAADEGRLDPAFDVDRRRRQLIEFLP